MDVPDTPGPPVPVVRLDVAVAQPVAVPLSQDATTEAEVSANRSSALASAALAAREALAAIRARQAVVPSQRAEPVAVLLLCSPVATDDPRTSPRQPASGHSTWEEASALPDDPGSGRSASPRVRPESRSASADASLVTRQPFAAAEQDAAVPVLPAVPPVVARHAGPSHRAAALDRESVAGASVTGAVAAFAASA
ncbi:hypothetical protein GCM10009559_59720 [Pseudonocardia zijingensis]|uniref:Uncharacterized protein n=1 Tax=Pseudonocardia zijingensis TaxID=153376 RepID=A0ABP3YNG1_9PSEU